VTIGGRPSPDEFEYFFIVGDVGGRVGGHRGTPDHVIGKLKDARSRDRKRRRTPPITCAWEPGDGRPPMTFFPYARAEFCCPPGTFRTLSDICRYPPLTRAPPIKKFFWSAKIGFPRVFPSAASLKSGEGQNLSEVGHFSRALDRTFSDFFDLFPEVSPLGIREKIGSRAGWSTRPFHFIGLPEN
jgi:hypothetical protein